MTACVRRARRDDLDALLALEAQFPGDRLSRRSLGRLLRSPSARVWVADAGDGRRGACADASPGARPAAGAAIVLLRRGSRVARLYSLAVDRGHRQRGVARALVRAVEDDAAAHGCREVRLEVRADNAAARRLYHALGYAAIGTLPAYYDDGGDGLRLARALA